MVASPLRAYLVLGAIVVAAPHSSDRHDPTGRRPPPGSAARLRGMPRAVAPSYTLGLHEIGDGLYAYLQPDGGWGHNNAGLVVDGDSALLVDTLFDLGLT